MAELDFVMAAMAMAARVKITILPAIALWQMGWGQKSTPWNIFEQQTFGSHAFGSCECFGPEFDTGDKGVSCVIVSCIKSCSDQFVC